MSRLGVIGALMVAGLILWGCGDPPGSPPAPVKGNLVVTALLPDSTLAGSVRIILDGVTLAGDTAIIDLQTGDTLWAFHNPDTLYDLVAGTHQVITKYQDSVGTSVVNYTGTKNVTVAPESWTQASIKMLGLAPNFSLVDLAGDTITLDDMAGTVRLLYFFSFG